MRLACPGGELAEPAGNLVVLAKIEQSHSILSDEADRTIVIGRRQRVPDRILHQPARLVPLARPDVESAHKLGPRPVQVHAQEFPKELMVAVPSALAVQ